MRTVKPSHAEPRPKPKPEPKPARRSRNLKPKHETKPEPKHESKPEPKPEPKHEVKPEAKPEAEACQAGATADDAARAMAILEGKPQEKAQDKARRRQRKFVVQVAALATQDKVDELQDKLRAAGITSYTQKVSARRANASACGSARSAAGRRRKDPRQAAKAGPGRHAGAGLMLQG